MTIQMQSERKGARRIADIPADILHALNQGEMATANLIEYLAVDLQQLLPATLKYLGIEPAHPHFEALRQRLPELKPLQRHWAIAEAFQQVLIGDVARQHLLATAQSDVIRQWAGMGYRFTVDLSLEEKLRAIRPFAADSHFGVREMAWMALRDAVIAKVPEALRLLAPWVQDADANIRRFASELTRPRGVWCAHCELLKADPALGLALLQPLKADPSRYVQDSVANWLNDAAKDHPEWVKACCDTWLQDSPLPATRYIVRRALRRLRSEKVI